MAGLEPGDRVDAWRIVRTLGQGGMATVYLAERMDGQFEQRVALKILHPSRHAANDDMAIDACEQGDGPDRILLMAGTYTLDLVNGSAEDAAAD